MRINKLLEIEYCYQCRWFHERKYYKENLHTARCHHPNVPDPDYFGEPPFDEPDSVIKIRARTIWYSQGDTTQCLNSFIEDWCPLPNPEDLTNNI